MPASTGIQLHGRMGGTLTLVLRALKVHMWKMELFMMCRPHRNGNSFDDAFGGVCSLHDMEMVVEPLSEKEIKKNMGDLRRKLMRSTSPHAGEICLNLIEISDSDLTWRDPIASQVISDDSNLVKELEGPVHLSFMRPAQHLQLVMPDVIRNKCTEFVENFSNDDLNGLSLKYRHNNTWKELEEDLVGIVEEILRALYVILIIETTSLFLC
ncbi:8567_t:CDS:2 [Entrophospora sp. SA101]|nr:8567_t:CDS:2 [Entrophospora sp. SA101]